MNATRQARGRGLGIRVARDERDEGRDRREAFTILELLLTFGLIALLATVLIGGGSGLLSEKHLSTDDVFWKACGEARKAALNSGHETKLGFADDREHGKRFTVDDGTGPRDFPVSVAGELTVNFLSAQKVSGSAVILAGQVVETQSLPFVTFYGDGTCTAFRVQIRFGVDAHILTIDPWTCAAVLTAPDEK